MAHQKLIDDSMRSISDPKGNVVCGETTSLDIWCWVSIVGGISRDLLQLSQSLQFNGLGGTKIVVAWLRFPFNLCRSFVYNMALFWNKCLKRYAIWEAMLLKKTQLIHAASSSNPQCICIDTCIISYKHKN